MPVQKTLLATILAQQEDTFKARRVTHLVELAEKMFAGLFCAGDIHLSRCAMLTKQYRHGSMKAGETWRFMHYGFRVGVFLVLLVWVVWDCLVDSLLRPDVQTHGPIYEDPGFIVYRGIASFILLYWLVGINVYVWNGARINFVYIFELNPATVPNHTDIFMRATTISIIFLMDFLLFFKMRRGDFFGTDGMRTYCPLVLFVVGFAWQVWSWRQPYNRTFWHVLGSIAIAPFTRVTFLRAYIADVLTSLVLPMIDVTFMICYFFSGQWHDQTTIITTDTDISSSTAVPIGGTGMCQDSYVLRRVINPLICFFPLWWRLQQNLRRYRATGKRVPNLFNALKYAIALSTSLFGVIHPELKRAAAAAETDTTSSIVRGLWLASFVVSTLYTFYWDVVMDWGLLKQGIGKLRSRLMFKSNYYYYIAIVVDIFLRFLWTLSIIPSEGGNPFVPSNPSSSSQTTYNPLIYLTPFIPWAEIVRRCIWGCFRLENEHLHNTQGFRRVDFVPLHFETAVAARIPTKPIDNAVGEQSSSSLGGARYRSSWKILIEMIALIMFVVGVAVAAGLYKG